MRKVFSNTDEVTHVWAQQTQDEGRAGNVYFHGKSIFSYGAHFEMARFISSNVVFVTTRTYSVSTARHLSGVRSAISHLTSFEVPTFDDHKANATAYLTGLTDDLYTISRRRKDPSWEIERYQAKAKEAFDYVAMFSTAIPADTKKAIRNIYAQSSNPLTAEVREKIKARAAAEREIKKFETARRAALEAADRAAAQVDLDGWAAGADSSRSFYDMPVRLRVKDGEIQTSRGASVPIIEARKLWRALRTDAGAVPGMRVGHYTVTRIDPVAKALIVGCHTIPMGEVARMAVKLGLESEVA